MAAINRILVSLLFGLISSFTTLLQLQVAKYINVQADHARRLVIMRLILFRFTCLLGRFLYFNGLNYSSKADKTHTKRTQTKIAANSDFCGLMLITGRMRS